MAATQRIGGFGPLIIGYQWGAFAITGILLFLRAIFASKKDGKWRWDFVWFSLAVALLVGSNITMHIAAFYGLGNHMSMIGNDFDSQNSQVQFSLFLNLPLNLVGCTFASWSIEALLLQAIGTHTASRCAVWILAFINGVANLTDIFALAFICQPVDMVWKPWLDGSCKSARFAENVIIQNSVLSGLTDLILACWPAVLVWSMNMSRRAKIGFSAFMVVMSLTAAPAFARIYLIKKSYADSSDPLYVSGLFFLCVTIETWMLAIAPSIVALRPLWKQLFCFCRRTTGHRTDTNPFVAQIESVASMNQNGFHCAATGASLQPANMMKYDVEDLSRPKGVIFVQEYTQS